MDEKEKVYQILRQPGNLPSLPQVLLKVIETCERDDIHLSELSTLIRKDPAISTRLLKLVNSAALGTKSRFVSLDQAVVYLGADTIKNIAVTASVYQVFGSLGKNEHFSVPQFWWHSLRTAVFARRIAEKTDYANLEEAYLAGLLNNLGELVLWMNFVQECMAVREREPSDPLEQCALEEELIGISHCEAGSWLVRHWKLGSFLADAILYHHAGLEQVQGGFPLVRIIRLAVCCHRHGPQDIAPVYEAGEQLFGLHGGEIDDIRTGVEEEVAETARALGVKATPPVEQQREAEPDLAGDTGKLIGLVKNYSLLNGFSAGLLQSETRDDQLKAVEQALLLLFDCEKVFFFLRDFERDRLYGCGSSANRYREEVRDLVLSLDQENSLLAGALQNGKPVTIRQGDKTLSGLADLQLLAGMGGGGMIYVPMRVRKKAVGVIVIGLPESGKGDLAKRPQSDLLELLAGQAAMALYLAEVKRIQEKKMDEARLEATAMTAARVVHEVNNPLGIIRNYLKVVELKLSDDDSVSRELAILDEEISRIARIIGKLDAFSAPAGTSRSLLDVNALLKDFLSVLSKSFFYSSQVRIRFQPDPEIPEILSDGELIKQIVLNLVKNAREALGTDGSIWVTTSCHRNNGGEYVDISVRDDGPGISEEEISRIFEPFTGSKGEGHSGLGLAIVRSLTAELQGRVQCRSETGKGAVFTVSLPVSNRSLPAETA